MILLVDDRRHKFRGIDVPSAHLKKMGMSGRKQLLHNAFQIIDLAHCHDGIGSVVGTHQKRLRFIVRNTADSQISFHLIYIFVKLGTKGRILNVVNRSVKSLLLTVYSHSRTPRTQVGMVIRSEK